MKMNNRGGNPMKMNKGGKSQLPRGHTAQAPGKKLADRPPKVGKGGAAADQGHAGADDEQQAGPHGLASDEARPGQGPVQGAAVRLLTTRVSLPAWALVMLLVVGTCYWAQVVFR